MASGVCALAPPAPERFEEGLERWFTATELYAIQLHEVDHDAYIAMKHREYRRQQDPEFSKLAAAAMRRMGQSTRSQKRHALRRIPGAIHVTSSSTRR